jgi:hypothetical protein
MRFYLGIWNVAWVRRVDIPLFISRTVLYNRKTYPRPSAPWALDSGAFTEINRNGKWELGAQEYARFVRKIVDCMPYLQWAAPQDWMCEPFVLKKTGNSVTQNQRLTVNNFLELQQLAPDLPWIPVVQGWTEDDYLRCVDMYANAGVDLLLYSTVGVGSVCRRQSSSEVLWILRTLKDLGLRLHAFGVKTRGLVRASSSLVSSDSMAWSIRGRHVRGECPNGKQSCSSCLHFALEWRQRLLDKIRREQ